MKKVDLKISIVFAFLFCLGIVLSSGYGSYYDFGCEVRTLLVNIKAYLTAAFGEHFYIGSKFESFISEIEKIDSYQDRNYGLAVYYPITPLLVLFRESGVLRYSIWKIYTFSINFLGGG